jgi:hypothetical protein
MQDRGKALDNGEPKHEAERYERKQGKRVRDD